MSTCPIKGCKTNLRRFKTDDDLEDHLDLHALPGGKLPQAMPTAIIPRALPPIPKSSVMTYEVFSPYCSPASFKKNRLTKAKQNALNLSSVDPTRAVSYLLEAWVDAEEDNSPAETKRRRTRISNCIATRPMRKLETLFQPPRFSGVVPRAPVVSVGFDSPGFQTLAQEAFAIVEAEGSDGETEPGSPTVKFQPSSDVELDSE
ncbi:hypothetical protein RhiJN_14249 [Ceratobasidium sp. AG-Ba]|nr:hypothetical protein RhiJN_14249 [Ceratobasidium sp. AG-Ba]QRW14800.1 hypothetical protein RhiLY_13799 [Ceratobasidium sp. AG-Ba]